MEKPIVWAMARAAGEGERVGDGDGDIVGGLLGFVEGWEGVGDELGEWVWGFGVVIEECWGVGYGWSYWREGDAWRWWFYVFYILYDAILMDGQLMFDDLSLRSKEYMPLSLPRDATNMVIFFCETTWESHNASTTESQCCLLWHE